MKLTTTRNVELDGRRAQTRELRLRGGHGLRVIIIHWIDPPQHPRDYHMPAGSVVLMLVSGKGEQEERLDSAVIPPPVTPSQALRRARVMLVLREHEQKGLTG